MYLDRWVVLRVSVSLQETVFAPSLAGGLLALLVPLLFWFSSGHGMSMIWSTLVVEIVLTGEAELGFETGC